jgi:hypothetical protein
MKIRLKCATCLGALLSVPITAFAVAGWTDYVPVAELTPTIHGRFLVKLKVPENPSGCKNKEVFYQDYNIPGSEQMYDALLKAVASGKKVRVYVTGKCELNGYSEISSVAIVP